MRSSAFAGIVGGCDDDENDGCDTIATYSGGGGSDGKVCGGRVGLCIQ